MTRSIKGRSSGRRSPSNEANLGEVGITDELSARQMRIGTTSNPGVFADPT
jgi:hypothetical protein